MAATSGMDDFANSVSDNRLTGLDALRGIAALVVALGHAFYVARIDIGSSFYLAVDVFFVLSGYVMARTYEVRGFDNFVRKRLRRLWPTIAVGVLIGAVAVRDLAPIVVLILTLTGLMWAPSFQPGPAFKLDPPMWSVVWEFAANLLHDGIFRHRPNWQLILLSATCAAWLIAAGEWSLNVGNENYNFGLGFPRAVMGYCIGIVLWRSLMDRPVLPFWPVLLLPLILFLDLPGLPFALLAAPLLVVCGLAGSRRLAWLGDFSFPLYAIHYPVLLLFGPWAGLTVAIVVAWLWSACAARLARTKALTALA